MNDNEWVPHRNGARYVLQRRLWSDAFGTAYEFYRSFSEAKADEP